MENQVAHFLGHHMKARQNPRTITLDEIINPCNRLMTGSIAPLDPPTISDPLQ